MASRSVRARLTDIVDSIERIRHSLQDVSLDEFEASWQKKWLVERGLEVLSEASRHLSDQVKARHPSIPWQKVAGIGNILRHDYERIAAPILWALAKTDLSDLDRACRAELEAFRLDDSRDG